MDYDTALTTVQRAKFALGDNEQDTALDEKLARLIPRISQAISVHCDRKFALADYTEIQTGNGFSIMNTKHWPIVSPLATVTNGGVYHDDSRLFSASSKLVEDIGLGTGDYVVHTGEEGQGKIELLASVFSTAPRNTKFIYRAGYTVIPYAVEEAAIEYILFVMKRQIAGVWIEDRRELANLAGSVRYIANKMPLHVQEMLEPWMKKRFW